MLWCVYFPLQNICLYKWPYAREHFEELFKYKYLVLEGTFRHSSCVHVSVHCVYVGWLATLSCLTLSHFHGFPCFVLCSVYGKNKSNGQTGSLISWREVQVQVPGIGGYFQTFLVCTCQCTLCVRWVVSCSLVFNLVSLPWLPLFCFVLGIW